MILCHMVSFLMISWRLTVGLVHDFIKYFYNWSTVTKSIIIYNEISAYVHTFAIDICTYRPGHLRGFLISMVVIKHDDSHHDRECHHHHNARKVRSCAGENDDCDKMPLNYISRLIRGSTSGIGMSFM